MAPSLQSTLSLRPALHREFSESITLMVNFSLPEEQTRESARRKRHDIAEAVKAALVAPGSVSSAHPNIWRAAGEPGASWPLSEMHNDVRVAVSQCDQSGSAEPLWLT